MAAACLIAATMASTPALAQKYYARQVVAPAVAGPTYTPTYGPFSACASGSQTAQVTGCKDQMGATVATSKCPAEPKVQACTAPTASCDQLTKDYWVSNTAKRLGSITVTGTTNAEMIEAGRTYCASFNATGQCQVHWGATENGLTGTVRMETGGTVRISQNSSFRYMAGNCTGS